MAARAADVPAICCTSIAVPLCTAARARCRGLLRVMGGHRGDAMDSIAVGTRITPRPPHRSVRAQLRHTACMGLFLSRGPAARTFSLLSSFLVSFLLFDRAAGFLPPRPQEIQSRRVQRRSRTALLQRRRRLVLDGREHGGMLRRSGYGSTDDPRGACLVCERNPRHTLVIGWVQGTQTMKQ
jgi:hypothetical protein